jgi:ICP0-binding domain of Ubiquitin-specific protease 7
MGIKGDQVQVYSVNGRTLLPQRRLGDNCDDYTLEMVSADSRSLDKSIVYFYFRTSKSAVEVQGQASTLVFIKYFDPAFKGRLEFMAPLEVKDCSSHIATIIPYLFTLKCLAPSTSRKMTFYKEQRPNSIVPLSQYISFADAGIKFGDVICFQCDLG